VATSLEDLVSMAIFARVVEAKSFTAAAAALSVSTSLVSKRVAALEERLGVRLLHRTTRSLSLTPEGATIYERCLHMLRAADEGAELAEHRADEPRGVLRVSCPIMIADAYVSDAVVSFIERHPAVSVELSVSNSMTDLVDDRIDLAIRGAPRLESSSLVARRLATMAKAICASPAYVEKHGTPRSPDDLRGHRCLHFSPLRADVEWRFREERAGAVVPTLGPLATDNAEALRRAALAGLGIVALPRFYLAGDLARGDLVELLPGFSLEPLGLFAVHAKGKVVPAKIRGFVEHMVRRLRAAKLD
jgi:DNA-binding transcriptional LysR family regulator